MSIGKVFSLLLVLGLLWPATLVRAETITLNFKDADIESVVNSVARITGRTFIVDPAVKGNVTIISSQPLRSDEVYAVFLSILQVHDFAAVETGNVTKIIPLAKAGQDLVITADGDRALDLPEDRIITRIHKLQNLQADKLVPILRPLLNTRAGQMSALAVKEGNSLIITERAGNVERLLRIVRRLDQESGGELEVIRLEYADAREVVAVITGLEIGSGRLSADQLRMAADGRTNSILMQGDEHHLLRAKAMIIHLDTPLAKDGDTQVVFLRYANAKDLMPILSGIELPEGQARSDGQASPRRTTQQRSDVNIQADEGTNALIMTGPPVAIQALQAVVRQLDIRRVQLMIEAVIAEVSTRKERDLGIQWLGGGEVGSTGVVGGTLFPESRLGIGSIVAQDPAALANLAGFNLGIIGGTTEILGTEFFNLGALVNALATDGDTNILSTPSLVTLDNHEAEIMVGQNVPFITGSYTQTGAGAGSVNPFQTIERRDVGIKLRVKPQVNEGDIIRLDIVQEVSSVAKDNPAGPTTNTRSITTSVLVEDGKVLVLGGLISDDLMETVYKVPLLGDIPLLGALFRYTSSVMVKRNLMVFLRPVILRDQLQSGQVSLDKYDLIRGHQLERDQKGVKLMPGESQPVLPEFELFEGQHSQQPPQQ
ncbi:MAG: type II secretion system secretin GspD [Desulfurivibrio sp.]